MIKKYDYEDFFEKIDSIIEYMPLLSIYNVLDDVYLYLTKEEKEFWEEYFKLYEQKNVSIFNLLHKEKFLNNAYCKKEEYEILKKRIFDSDIKYIDSNINKLSYKRDEKFDLIYISNIIGRIISYDMKTIFKVIKDLGKILNKDGIIYDYNMYGDLWRESYFPNLTDNDFNKILSEELPNYSIERDEISNSSGSVVYKFKLK